MKIAGTKGLIKCWVCSVLVNRTEALHFFNTQYSILNTRSISKLLSALLFIQAASLPSISQPQSVYWVQFENKSSNVFLQPSVFLSEKSIARRAKQNIPVGEGDYPIYQPYVQTIANLTDSVIHQLKWFNAITVVLHDTTKLANIRALDFVKTVQRIDVPVSAAKNLEYKLKTDLQYTAVSTENRYGTADNQTKMLRLDKLHEAGYRGKDIMIAVFDNGFSNVNQINAYKHLFEENRVLFTYDYVGRLEDVFRYGSHGTYVLSTMAAYESQKFIGTAPDANYLLFITEDNDSETIMEELHWAEAAEKADSIGADIFTTSLGYITYEQNFPNRTFAEMNGNHTIITQAANIAYSKGILVVNSAGNEGAKPWRYVGAPADGKDVLSVGAVDDKRQIANFSSRGPNASGQLKPEVCAQGARVAVLDAGGFNAFSAGTSFSCPIISGSAACLWQAFPERSAKEIKEAIIKSAHLFSEPNNDYGHGIPNIFNAYLALNKKFGEVAASEIEMLVFPNPLQPTSNLFIRSKTDGNYRLTLSDLNGRILHRVEFQLTENDLDLIPLDFASTLSAGNYLLQIVSPSGKKTIRVFQSLSD